MTQNFPLVTIGVITYNNLLATNNDRDLMISSLDCLIAQDYPNFEIIIQDDCSTDETPEILKEYARKYSFVKYFQNERNLGVYENLAVLMPKVLGKYFMRACIDDYYDPSYLSKCVEQLEAHPEKATCHSYFLSENLVDNILKTEKNIFYSLDVPVKNQKYAVEEHWNVFYLNCLWRSKYAKIIFGNSVFSYFEQVASLLLVGIGGICSVPEFLFRKKSFFPKNNAYIHRKEIKHDAEETLIAMSFLDKYPNSSVTRFSSSLYLRCWHTVPLFFALLALRLKVKIRISYLLAIWCFVFKNFVMIPLFYNFLNKRAPFIIKANKAWKKWRRSSITFD